MKRMNFGLALVGLMTLPSSGLAQSRGPDLSHVSIEDSMKIEITSASRKEQRVQEKAAGGQTGIVLGLAVLFAYLFLVALYESWNHPAAGAAVGHGRPARRDRRRPAVPAWRSTSTRRSAWSCWWRWPPRTAS